MELYILGVLVALAILVVIKYFDDDDITVGELACCTFLVVLSWFGVLIFVAYYLFEVLPKFLNKTGILNKVVWKRKK